jgi:hypothetical protein
MSPSKPNPPDLTARNLKPLLKRITTLEQEVVMLKGDRNKLQAQIFKLQTMVEALARRPILFLDLEPSVANAAYGEALRRAADEWVAESRRRK